MKLLLDTHVLVWVAAHPELLSAKAAALVSSEQSVLSASSASVWEIATKVRLKRFPEAAKLEAHILEEAAANGYTFLDITPEIALRAGRLTGSHGDPFDRMIAAHALAEDMPVISADTKLDQFGVRRIW